MSHGFETKERGTVAINGDLVFAKYWTATAYDWLIPRAHVGVMANVDGKTSYAYVGLLWTYNFTKRFFAEISFGAALNNGLVDGSPERNAVGCHLGYDPGASVGMHLNADWSVMVTFDHISNGEPTLSTCPWNEGINEFGVRLGYTFH